MPSGQTHDRITLWSLPIIAGCTYLLTHRNSDRTLIVAGAFLFSGLMFGPDLDIYSVQYKRWGYLRYLWIPYQKTLKHRSFFSHGLIIGTTVRLIYLAFWLSLVGIFAVGIAELWGDISWNWQLWAQLAKKYTYEWIALFVGLEMGAISHILSDRLGSFVKRQQRNKIKKSTTK
ncbi:metal-binding protein [Chlorogloea sp. CCALA 695]|uniref:metal-binding protein n=1 Tax=Chlorogloea sp. CCALA 695 TaxID=2107693 RepID=UPI000D084B27|nr:metal-binding protein [Chlorogloea sp. CCALA 695]PSB29145.1 metal-binding protein [Chlorogloea sp. CCALA 695]